MSRHCTRCRTPYAEERFCPLDGGVVVEEQDSRGRPADRLLGQTLAGRYLIHRGIGQGGMGVVYEAEHTGLGKRVAVKLLLDNYSEDREVLARFHQEARTASRMGHENIIDIIDIGEHDGRSFIVMEFLEGHDLRRECRDLGALPIERGVYIVKQIARALEAAHGKDVIHRDLKPENVFLTIRGGQRDFVKIMDFGISKIKAAHDSQVRLTQTGAVIGTPLYMAPEQALGSADIDQRADIYSLGVMMYELFVGRPPFEAPTYLALMAQHLNEPPPVPRKARPELPTSIEKAILRSLEKDPARRFQSMRELERALPEVSFPTPSQTVISANGTAPNPDVAAPHIAKVPAPTGMRTIARDTVAPGRKALWIAAAVLVAAGASAGIFFAVRSGNGSRDGNGNGNGSGSGAEQNVAQSTVPTDQAPPPKEVPPGPQVSPMDPIGTLEVQSSPSGAQVYLDDQPQGTTPLALERVAAGKHIIRLELAGYATVEMEKVVRAGMPETFFGAMAVAKRGSGASGGGAHGTAKGPNDAKVDAKADPKADAKVDPKADAKVDPKVDPKTGPPRGDPAIDPRADPTADPKTPPRSGDPVQDTKPTPPRPHPLEPADPDKKKNPYDPDKKKNPYLKKAVP